MAPLQVRITMLTRWLHDLESLEAISRDEDARRILLRLAAISQAGRTDTFLLELAVDPVFLVEMQDYFRNTRTLQ